MDINWKYWTNILDSPWRPSKADLSFQVQEKNKPDDTSETSLMTPVEKLKIVSPFWDLKFFNKPDDTSGKVKICEPYLGHI